MASKTQETDEIVDMDGDEILDMDDTEHYEPAPVSTIDTAARRRRIEELMEEKQLRNSIFGEFDW